jgi:hypothetical protein
VATVGRAPIVLLVIFIMEGGGRYPCHYTCGRSFKTPGSRGMHHVACRRKCVDTDVVMEEVCMEAEAQEEAADDVDRGESDGASSEEELDLYADAQEEADADDVAAGEMPAALPHPEVQAPAEGSNLFYQRQLGSGAGAFIKGPLQRVLDLPAATLRLAKAFYHPKVNLSAAGMKEMVGLVKDPLFCQNPKRVPSVASVAKDVNEAVSRDKDTAAKRTKIIDLQALRFPARFSTVAFTWTCLIALCVELLLDPRICNAENMQFEGTYDGQTYGELPTGAWWAGEEVTLCSITCE